MATKARTHIIVTLDFFIEVLRISRSRTNLPYGEKFFCGYESGTKPPSIRAIILTPTPRLRSVIQRPNRSGITSHQSIVTSIQQSVTTQVPPSLTPYSCGGFGYLQSHFGGSPPSSWADEFGTASEKPSANESTNNVLPSLISFMSSSLTEILGAAAT